MSEGKVEKEVCAAIRSRCDERFRNIIDDLSDIKVTQKEINSKLEIFVVNLKKELINEVTTVIKNNVSYSFESRLTAKDRVILYTAVITGSVSIIVTLIQQVMG